MKENNFKLGQTVYHRKVYDHREPLKIVGIRENELELEGDYTGGIYNVCEKDWLPIKGVSRIYNHAYKQECIDYVSELNKIREISSSIESHQISKLIGMILKLTNEVSLNPEY
jgi:hypothetical protein